LAMRGRNAPRPVGAAGSAASAACASNGRIPSAASHDVGSPSLLVGFPGTTRPSDFPSQCSPNARLVAFSGRPVASGASAGYPHSHAPRPTPQALRPHPRGFGPCPEPQPPSTDASCAQAPAPTRPPKVTPRSTPRRPPPTTPASASRRRRPPSSPAPATSMLAWGHLWRRGGHGLPGHAFS
jgi:hypothetical protein